MARGNSHFTCLTDNSCYLIHDPRPRRPPPSTRRRPGPGIVRAMEREAGRLEDILITPPFTARPCRGFAETETANVRIAGVVAPHDSPPSIAKSNLRSGPTAT